METEHTPPAREENVRSDWFVSSRALCSGARGVRRTSCVRGRSTHWTATWTPLRRIKRAPSLPAASLLRHRPGLHRPRQSQRAPKAPGAVRRATGAAARRRSIFRRVLIPPNSGGRAAPARSSLRGPGAGYGSPRPPAATLRVLGGVALWQGRRPALSNVLGTGAQSLSRCAVRGHPAVYHLQGDTRRKRAPGRCAASTGSLGRRGSRSGS